MATTHSLENIVKPRHCFTDSMLLASFYLSLFGEIQKSLSIYLSRSLRLMRQALPINLAFNSPPSDRLFEKLLQN
ncbi:hypothetical protein NWP22_05395 [Anabaenopsis tanganyikae CS-531]|uniref:Uncharacterized protein n=2 Tax=Anabaenopsis TaxID=110103 RepID=A0ABT5AVE5_9CYAN|nr:MULTISPECIES: hypothetical protein [Anabaenopsis]MDB9540894.1 hypothetical protein [Anabaenopsis arnoldii]MDH6093332.1 hypothetical protein [Anabaenopsis arnoldii]MDH6105308.1 hypothetical protein [Anabaenopsis tanganyikae CS-531]